MQSGLFKEKRSLDIQEDAMNEFKRCINVFTHSPFQVRLMLLNMICDWVSGKPQQAEDKQ